VVNKTTFKASLTQMLVVVFHRMDPDLSTIPLQPIVVCNLMEPVEKSSSDVDIHCLYGILFLKSCRILMWF
jgi:brefeldin A-inhibited guanine nucleotide-exchange protein